MIVLDATIVNVALPAIQQDLGLYAEAEIIFRRSAGIAEGLSGDGSDLERLRVRSLSHLADIIRVQGRYREAELLFERALSLAEAAFGPRDLHVSSVLNGWAVCYKYSGRFEDAERLYRRALEIMEKALGPVFHYIANTLVDAFTRRAQSLYGPR